MIDSRKPTFTFVRIFLFLVTLLFVLSNVSLAGDENKIRVFQMWSSESINASANDTSDKKVDLAGLKPNGYFSIQLTLTGDGTAKIEYLLSNDDITYLEPSSATDIVTGFTKTSGPGSDGNDIFTFSPEMTRYLKLKATETGGANGIVVTAVLAVQ